MMSEVEDQIAFRKAVKDKERDKSKKARGPMSRSLVIAFWCLIVIGLVAFVSGNPNLFTESAIEKHMRENPESMKAVSEELWGKPEESINKLPQLD